MTISLPPELAARLDLLAERSHRGKRSTAAAALIRKYVTKSGEIVAAPDNA